jgi:hypothetical protein
MTRVFTRPRAHLRLSAIATLLLACSHHRYDEVRDRWTREATRMHQFDTALDISATLRTWEFREAYAQREIDWFRLEEPRASEVRGRERAEHAAATEVFLAVRTHSEKWNDFAAKQSSWRVVLVDDRGLVSEPVAILHVGKIKPLMRAFFPYADTFAYAYRIRFPKRHADGTLVMGPDTRSIRMKISGPLGKADLVWKFR